MYGFLIPLALLELGGFLAAAQFSNTITTGSIIVGVLVSLAALIAIAWGSKFRVSYQAAAARAEQQAAHIDELLQREERLETRLAERDAKLDERDAMITELRTVIERLEALPNLERVIRLMSDTAERQDRNASERLRGALEEVRATMRATIAEHDIAAAARHLESLNVSRGITELLQTLVERQAA